MSQKNACNPVCARPNINATYPEGPNYQTYADRAGNPDLKPELATGVDLSPLLQMNEVAVLPATHALCRKRVLRPTDFAGQAFVSLAEGDPYRQAIDAVFVQAGVQRAAVLETASAVAVCALVQQGLGVAIVNPLTAAAMAGPRLVVRPLQADISFRVSLLLPQVAAPHPLRDALVAALRQACDGVMQKHRLAHNSKK